MRSIGTACRTSMLAEQSHLGCRPRSLLAGTRSKLELRLPEPVLRPEFTPPVVVRRSPRLVRFFTRHVKRFYLARDFHAVRLSKSGIPGPVPDGPLIIVLNHPSWWDPLVGLVLAELFPDRAHYAPMDANALGRYRIFERLGMFGVEPGPCEERGNSSAPAALYSLDRGQRSGSRLKADLPTCANARRAFNPAWLISHTAWTMRSFCLWLWSISSGTSVARKRSPGSVTAIVVERGADRTVEEWRTLH